MSGSEKTYEMNWDCEYCGQKKLLGVTHRHCPECGAPQNPEKRYFPPDDQKVAVEDHEFVGADLHCPSCRDAQSAKVKHCANCGSPMDGGRAAAQQAEQVVGPGGAVQAPPAAAAPGAEPPKKSKSWLGIVIGLVVLAIIAFIVLRFVWKVETGVTVTSHTWTREIPIERYREVQDKGDCSSMPKGAKELSRKKGKKECKTRKIDQGDGTFKEKKECKTAADQCTYRVTKWAVARTLKENGDGVDSKPEWPRVKLAKTGKCIGCEREGDRTERYTVHFKEAKSGDKLSCSFAKATKWKSFEVGSSYKGEKHGLGGDLDCDSLKAGK